MQKHALHPRVFTITNIKKANFVRKNTIFRFKAFIFLFLCYIIALEISFFEEKMKYVSDKDRKYIENKYHRQDEPFDPTDRFAYHSYEYDEKTGLDDAQMESALLKLQEEHKNEERALIKARGFAFVLDNARIDAPSEDYFFGFYNWGRPLNKPITKRWYNELFDSMPDVKELRADYVASGTGDLWLDTDHVVP